MHAFYCDSMKLFLVVVHIGEFRFVSAVCIRTLLRVRSGLSAHIRVRALRLLIQLRRQLVDLLVQLFLLLVQGALMASVSVPVSVCFRASIFSCTPALSSAVILSPASSMVFCA